MNSNDTENAMQKSDNTLSAEDTVTEQHPAHGNRANLEAVAESIHEHMLGMVDNAVDTYKRQKVEGAGPDECDFTEERFGPAKLVKYFCNDLAIEGASERYITEVAAPKLAEAMDKVGAK